MRGLSRGRDEDGFTLVETLAAFAILVMVLSALFVALSGAIRANARAVFTTTAVRLAQSSLAELGLSVPLASGRSQGRYDNGYQWLLEVTPYQGDEALYWTQITVRASAQPGAATFTLTGLKRAAERP